MSFTYTEFIRHYYPGNRFYIRRIARRANELLSKYDERRGHNQPSPLLVSNDFD